MNAVATPTLVVMRHQQPADLNGHAWPRFRAGRRTIKRETKFTQPLPSCSAGCWMCSCYRYLAVGPVVSLLFAVQVHWHCTFQLPRVLWFRFQSGACCSCTHLVLHLRLSGAALLPEHFLLAASPHCGCCILPCPLHCVSGAWLASLAGFGHAPRLLALFGAPDLLLLAASFTCIFPCHCIARFRLANPSCSFVQTVVRIVPLFVFPVCLSIICPVCRLYFSHSLSPPSLCGLCCPTPGSAPFCVVPSCCGFPLLPWGFLCAFTRWTVAVPLVWGHTGLLPSCSIPLCYPILLAARCSLGVPSPTPASAFGFLGSHSSRLCRCPPLVVPLVQYPKFFKSEELGDNQL